MAEHPLVHSDLRAKWREVESAEHDSECEGPTAAGPSHYTHTADRRNAATKRVESRRTGTHTYPLNDFQEGYDMAENDTVPVYALEPATFRSMREAHDYAPDRAEWWGPGSPSFP